MYTYKEPTNKLWARKPLAQGTLLNPQGLQALTSPICFPLLSACPLGIPLWKMLKHNPTNYNPLGFRKQYVSQSL